MEKLDAPMPSPSATLLGDGNEIFRQLLRLPRDTEIRQPDGMWRPLTENEYESANQTDTIYGDGFPFWVQGWRDLHHRLRIPRWRDAPQQVA